MIGTADSRRDLLPSTSDPRPGKAIGRKPQSERIDDATGGDPLLEAILREERRDAFDPQEFNRQKTTAVPR